MTATTRSYGGETASQRRDRRRAVLLEATLDLIAEGGTNSVTKRAVCGRARLNDRYFYEHFADRDNLLEVLARELTAQGLEAVLSAALRPGLPLRAQIHAAVEEALDFMTIDPRRGQLLVQSYTTGVLQLARTASARTIAAAMAAMISDFLGDAAPPRLDSDMAAYTAVSGVMELVAAWFRNEFDTSRQHLAGLITGMLASGVDLAAHLPHQ